MNLLFLDTETSGLDPQSNGILQLSAEFHSDGKLVNSFNERIKHDSIKVDLGALKVNRIKLGQVDSLGLPHDFVMAKFVDWLLMLHEQYSNIVVVGHNLSFDVNFIKAALQKMGCYNVDAVLPYRVIDTSGLARFLASLGVKELDEVFNAAQGSSLAAIAKGLGLKVPTELHNSAVDVELTAAVFYKFQQLMEGLLNEKTATNTWPIVNAIPCIPENVCC